MKTIFELYIGCFLSRYFQFSGRARRKEFWSFVLFTVILLFISVSLSDSTDLFEFLTAFIFLGSAIPGLAVAIRRMHDVDKSGTMLLVYFIPIIGFFWLSSLLITSGTPGKNRYGADPKNPLQDNEIDLIGSE